MAKKVKRAQTLIEKMGFNDPDLYNKDHESLSIWLRNETNLDGILRQIIHDQKIKEILIEGIFPSESTFETHPIAQKYVDYWNSNTIQVGLKSINQIEPEYVIQHGKYTVGFIDLKVNMTVKINFPVFKVNINEELEKTSSEIEIISKTIQNLENKIHELTLNLQTVSYEKWLQEEKIKDTTNLISQKVSEIGKLQKQTHTERYYIPYSPYREPNEDIEETLVEEDNSEQIEMLSKELVLLTEQKDQIVPPSLLKSLIAQSTRIKEEISENQSNLKRLKTQDQILSQKREELAKDQSLNYLPINRMLPELVARKENLEISCIPITFPSTLYFEIKSKIPTIELVEREMHYYQHYLKDCNIEWKIPFDKGNKRYFPIQVKPFFVVFAPDDHKDIDLRLLLAQTNIIFIPAPDTVVQMIKNRKIHEESKNDRNTLAQFVNTK